MESVYVVRFESSLGTSTCEVIGSSPKYALAEALKSLFKVSCSRKVLGRGVVTVNLIEQRDVIFSSGDILAIVDSENKRTLFRVNMQECGLSSRLVSQSNGQYFRLYSLLLREGRKSYKLRVSAVSEDLALAEGVCRATSDKYTPYYILRIIKRVSNEVEQLEYAKRGYLTASLQSVLVPSKCLYVLSLSIDNYGLGRQT